MQCIWKYNTEKQKNIMDEESGFKSIEKLIRRYVPQSKLLSNEDWLRIKEKYIANAESFVQYQEIKSNCLFDYILGTQSLDIIKVESCVSMIQHINDQIDQALNIVISTPKIKIGVENIIRNIIISINPYTEPVNSIFKNWINELFLLNHLYSIETYTLIDLERVLPNGKSVDYVLSHNETKEEILIDAFTIHNIDPMIYDTEEKFNEKLAEKITKKYNSKMRGLSGYNNFFVVPIIEYKKGMEQFKVIVSQEKSIKALTVFKSRENGKEQALILDINEYSATLLNQND